ncbi:MAG: hypothetical protein ACRESE_07485 [Gammaproteobacteria bacterium]
MSLYSFMRPLLIGFVAYLLPALAFASPVHNGQGDMNFNLGSWTVHIKTLHRSAGVNHWNNFEGTAVVHKVWAGRAQLEEIEAKGMAGHLQALVLFLYDPQTGQWNKTFATSSDGLLGQPMYGEFKNGRGEFYDQELFHGRVALLRAVWSHITATSSCFEESSSDDGGRTWEPYFIAKFRRSTNRRSEKTSKG